MWISVEGASFLGSVLPVAILIVLVESRAAAVRPRTAVTRLGFLKIYSRDSAAVATISAVLAVPAIAFCFIIVNSGEGSSGVMAWWIGLVTPVLAVSAGAALLDLAELLMKAESQGAAAFEPAASPLGTSIPHPPTAQKKSSKKSTKRRKR